MPTSAPWLRGLIFTLLVPGMIGGVAPMIIDSNAQASRGFWRVGWILIAAGAVIYTLCLIRFLAAAGTPAIFFTRHIRFLLGEEPKSLVSKGLYRFSRNPMYVGVLMAIFGQAIVFASFRIAVYGVVAFAFFHVVVVFLEEPHLRSTLGKPYEQYCQNVRRWL